MRRFFKRFSKRGSALLIVLGFLSFMMVSAVSFAIYMRIERQASSNYRHAITARHMLNAALYRAIDEIDSELRIERVNTEADLRARKYPEWPGHTKPSAVPNGMDNGQESRVLSMEALSFIPGIYVNDVRRYAVTNENDSVSGVSVNNDKYSYLGTKWRSLSMPVNSIVGGENAYEEAVVGRYSYLCVNVSDMFDVNVCKATVRDSVTNRVSIGHLFGPNSDARRKTFDDYVDNTGIKFETLQDFYACMFKINDPTFGSPYHEYMQAGNAIDADAGFDEAANQVIITDALAKAQPATATACNILLQQPISPANLTMSQSASVSLQNTPLQGRDGFQDAVVKTFTGRLPGGAALDVFPVMLADYIDEDNIPKALNMPTVELVPMVSQILVPTFFKPRIMSIDGPAVPPATPPKIFSLNAVPVGGPAVMQVNVELVWPYKRLKDRTCPASSSYEVEVLAYLKVHTTPKQSNGFQQMPTAANGYIKLMGKAQAPDFSTKNDDNQDECYKPVVVNLTVQGVPTIDIVKSDAPTTFLVPDCAPGQPFQVSMIVSARVKAGNIYVDSVPQMLPYPRFGGVNDDSEFMVTPNKLYFQTTGAAFDPATATLPANGLELTYDWTSLEVPDPRFNYSACNWLKDTVDLNAIPPRGFNPSTQLLLGKEGRDGDIFMSVSDAGKLQSPGELGFILRPFNYKPAGVNAGVDFRNRLTIDPNVDESAAYFRTVRLYDHDNNVATDKIKITKDPVYDYFTAQNSDGSVPGARVNPLSDSPLALAAAVELTPADYWFASRDVNNSSERTDMMDNTYNKYLSTQDWRNFTNAWSKCLAYLRTTPQGKNMKTTWKYGLSDYYGDFDKFGWYSAGDPLTIFSPNGYATAGVPASLTTPLHEIDRKMLYSFSLDSFSDRQQLFLYILRAEVTVPSFGSSQESGTKSLAGGRAVALVWRDPYPEGYDKTADSWLNKGSAYWYSTNKRMSPWYQVNIKKYDDDREPYDTDSSISQRFDGYHQHKILYFKQLDN
jgi:hypothetical protein